MQKNTKIATRLYVPDALASGIVVSLTEAQAHQLRHVLRLESGASVALFNGSDGEWVGEATIEKRGASVRLVKQTRQQTSPSAIWLAFAPLKTDRMTMLVEKTTELGVGKLLPVITSRTQGSNRINPEKLAHSAREAAEQCERLDVPVIDPPQRLESFLAGWDAVRPLFVCAERGQAQPVWTALQNACAPVGFLIGPEGGFTEEEFAQLRARSFVTPVSLGPTILRAETAAIAALACWQAVGHSRVGIATEGCFGISEISGSGKIL